MGEDQSCALHRDAFTIPHNIDRLGWNAIELRERALDGFSIDVSLVHFLSSVDAVVDHGGGRCQTHSTLTTLNRASGSLFTIKIKRCFQLGSDRSSVTILADIGTHGSISTGISAGQLPRHVRKLVHVSGPVSPHCRFLEFCLRGVRKSLPGLLCSRCRAVPLRIRPGAPFIFGTTTKIEGWTSAGACWVGTIVRLCWKEVPVICPDGRDFSLQSPAATEAGRQFVQREQSHIPWHRPARVAANEKAPHQARPKSPPAMVGAGGR